MIYTADFTGHGVAAALNAARFHSFVHIDCQSTDKPAALLARLNKRLHQVLPVGDFATMFCATIDLKSQRIEYASAGAPPQLYRGCADSSFELLCKPSLPLGIAADAIYDSETAPFRPGGAVVLYTDGLIETPRPPRSKLTAHTLMDFVAKTGRVSSFEICQSVIEELFPGPDDTAEDDITIAVVQHTGRSMDDIVDYEI
jgi:phosphoserine phosphatase RsbU/P